MHNGGDFASERFFGMSFKFNPLDVKHKNITGGVPENHSVLFSVESDAEWMEMILYGDNGPISRLFSRSGENFSLELSLKRGLYFYKIIAYYECGVTVYGADEKLMSTENGECWQLTVFSADYSTPEWIKGGIIYQIFPDRFYRSGDFTVGKNKVARYDWGGTPVFRSPDGIVRNNEFFGGNIKGITEKLDYLSSLGVTAVYLNPVCESYSSHRYDTGDYLKIDSVLGTEADVKTMTDEGEKRGIRFIFDGVFNHTGAGSRYFNKYGDYDSQGAYSSKQSPYYDWYTFRNYPDDYECWWDFKTLPSIKKDSVSFQSFITEKGGVLSYWTGLGFKGVRLDVADELTDDFIKKIRKSLKAESADNLLIGEVWEDATNKIAYGVRRKYFCDGELDSVMNYPLKDAIVDFILSGNCKLLESTVRTQINNYPKTALDCLMNVLSTHDSVRAITLFGRKTPVCDKDEMATEKLTRAEYLRGCARLKCASVLQFFLYGVPSVYYGDEAGLEGDLDPYNRRCYNWNDQDKELLAHYERLATLRGDNADVLKDGKTEILHAHGGAFIFARRNELGSLIVAVNVGGQTLTVSAPTCLTELYGGAYGKNFDLEPYGFLILKAGKDSGKDSADF